MTKSKRHPHPDAAQGAPGPARADTGRGARLPMLFEVPFAVTAPRLINPGLGLASLVPSSDPDASYTIDVTLLDSPDHRLIRSGVLLAHRVLDGVGEWYLSAEGWQPYLPAEQTEPMSADLPQAFADLVRPFRRIGALGPVAALTCERRGTVFRDATGGPVAEVHDARVTVRRGGLTTARFREVQISPGRSGLDDAQREFLTRALVGLGAVLVPGFPSLTYRLGAPGTGLSDYPVPRPLSDDDALTSWLSNLITLRTRELIQADLSVRQGANGYAADVGRTAHRLRAELRGVGQLLETQWLDDISEDLEWLGATSEEELVGRLRGERYLSLLEQLVNAARAPKLGDVATEPARKVLRGLMNDALSNLAAQAESAAVDGPDGEWQAIVDAADAVLDACAVCEYLIGKPVRRIRKHLLPLREELVGCLLGDLVEVRTRALAAEAAQAFVLGRQYEQGIIKRNARRRAWLNTWGTKAEKLLA